MFRKILAWVLAVVIVLGGALPTMASSFERSSKSSISKTVDGKKKNKGKKKKKGGKKPGKGKKKGGKGVKKPA